MSLRVALVGCGAWGQNLLRVLVASPRARVVAVADPSVLRLSVAASLAPEAALVPSLDEAIARGLDAVLIAAAPHAHAGLVTRALGAGLDVFVEKPLALRPADAERCAALASTLGRVAMVGHLLRYHPTVERLLHLARSGALGPLLGLDAARCSTAGRIASPSRSSRERSALWMLGPHDVSILHALDPSPIHTIAARTGAGGDPVIVDAELTSGLAFTATFSRAAPTKERILRVIGTTASAVFDDVRAPDRLLVGGTEITVPWREPLAAEIDHFLGCVETRARPRTPLDDGVTVVRALALAEEQHGALAVAGA